MQYPVKTLARPTFMCRNCQFFTPCGYRYGQCSKIKVLVPSHESCCYLGTKAFGDS